MWRFAIRSRPNIGTGAAAASMIALVGSEPFALEECDDIGEEKKKQNVHSSIFTHQSHLSQCEQGNMIIHPNSVFTVSSTSNPASPSTVTSTPTTSTGNTTSASPPEAKLVHRPSNNITGGSNFCLSDVYDIDQVLGEGAYGMVYKARRKADGTLVAVKTMPRSLTGKTDFEREVAALQLLSKPPGHDHVVKFYDLHRDEKYYYLVMELVEGGELLDSLIDHGPYSEAIAASFLRQFAEALSYVHDQGLTHADLKPENLLLTTSNELKLADFGCAKSHDLSKKDMKHLPAHEFAMVRTVFQFSFGCCCYCRCNFELSWTYSELYRTLTL
jgi:Protein kinase domain